MKKLRQNPKLIDDTLKYFCSLGSFFFAYNVLNDILVHSANSFLDSRAINLRLEPI